MSANGDPTGRKPRRLSPEELAGEVARRLRLDRGAHRRRRRGFDVVTASRIAMVLGVILLGTAAVFGAAWVGRLAGFETTGVVIEETPVFGCPGEPELGVAFSGETVQLVGRSEDGEWFVLRDERGPGDVAFVDAHHISPGEDSEKLPVRDCDPRRVDQVAAAVVTPGTGEEATTTSSAPVTTTTPEQTTTTTEVYATPSRRPPRRSTPNPGTTTTTTATTQPGVTTTTTRATTTTTRPGTTTTSTPSSTTTTTQPTTTTLGTTTTTVATTTTTEATTTTTEATTTTTEATTTTTTTTPP